MNKIAILIALLVVRILLSQTTETFDATDRRHSAYFYETHTYGSIATNSSSFIGVDQDQQDKPNYFSSVTWDISSISNWAFVTNAKLKCYIEDAPDNTLRLQIWDMTTLPSGYGSSSSFCGDVGDGDYMCYNADITPTDMNQFRPFTQNEAIPYIEERLDDSWIALGFSERFPASTHDTYAEMDFSQLRFDYQVRMSTSGQLNQDERWGGTHELTGNITVPSGKTLTLWQGLDLDLNQYYIKSTGGTIVVQSGVDFEPCEIVAQSGGVIQGYYPSISSAHSNTATGTTIYVHSSHTLSGNLEIDYKTLRLEGGTLGLSNYKLTTGNYGSIVFNGGSVSPNIKRETVQEH